MPHTKSTSKATSASASTKKPPTTRARTTAKSDSTPDAVQLLTKDHKEVRALFKAYEKLVKEEADSKQKQSLAMQICTMLKIHTSIEEETFYPAAREALGEQDLLDEAEVEHASSKELIAQIESMSPDEPLYDAKVIVLGEYIEHHVKEEETEMFPKAKKAKMELEQLGEEMSARKDELMSEAADALKH